MRNFITGFLLGLLLSPNLIAQSPSSVWLDMNEFEIKHVGFNTDASDFGPAFVGDYLWFSAYPNTQVKRAILRKAESVYYTLFKTPVDSRGFTTYEPRQQVEGIVNNYHKGPVSYCAKTGELFVTLSNTIKYDVVEEGNVVKKEKIKLRMVICKNINGVWTVQKELPFNDPLYSVGHPSISATGDTLFFTSDLPSQSMGGTDIFMVIRKDSVWGTPVSLGSNINTSGDEMFPFYHPSGMLFFASDGHPDGKGGLDLYVSDLTSDGFSQAKPLDFFNTKHDDFGLILHSSGESGYFVSNRPGQNGDDDIYLVKIRKAFMQVTATVVDDVTGKPVKGADVVLYNCEGKELDHGESDLLGECVFKLLKNKCLVIGAKASTYSENRKSVDKSNQAEIRLKHDRSLEIVTLDYFTRNPVKNSRMKINDVFVGSTSATGSFVMDLWNEKMLDVSISAPGYLTQTVQVNAIDKGKVRQTVLMMKADSNKPFLIEGLSFDSDSSNVNAEGQAALDKLYQILIENPSIVIEIGSHTDSQGGEEHNQVLSQKRADSAAYYLIKKGIPRKRIVSRGYGESKLLNQCKDGVECSEDEHRVNRRTEFKIIRFLN